MYQPPIACCALVLALGRRGIELILVKTSPVRQRATPVLCVLRFLYFTPILLKCTTNLKPWQTLFSAAVLSATRNAQFIKFFVTCFSLKPRSKIFN